MMRITAEAVSVEIGGKPLLDGVDLEVRPGELTGLIGPNGAGKTTLLRVLGALRPPGSGRVLYDGKAIARRERPALARRLAYLAQGGEAHWPLRVERLVALGRLPHQGPLGRTSAEDQAAVERALQRSGVEHLRARTLATLSGGERMQVLLARALAVEAEALLADEPVAALDPHHQLRVMDLLRAEARAGKAVVVVLHDLSLAARFCDRLALLHRGRLLAQGQPETVLGDRELASAYGVRVLRGMEKGEPFLLPWERL
ncbi:ABC transporter ATP-binding protein [Aquibaculum sediminis]|uniref:ABC transporter ATP-binding protein n=1 Tax=Aquibaculum sediminis TaxID=3231907 RepID=UPI003455A3BC